MTEQKFKSEMRRAKMMQETADPMRSEYWAGYQRGLRRAYHGENFGTEAEHALWMAAVDSPDESRKQRGLGYRDGLAFGEFSSRIGRPSVGNTTMDQITLPSELKAALEAKAESIGISVADARREAYRKFTE